jgi:hypothetical protein
VERLLLAVGVVVVAALVAEVVRRARHSDAPTQARWQLPTQLDRRDFDHPDVPWLVAVFSSTTCSTCADVLTKAQVLASADVAVQAVPYQDHKELHARYGIDAVPGVVIADSDGVVRASFLGPMTATDLWAAFAEARAPGSVSDGESRH